MPARLIGLFLVGVGIVAAAEPSPFEELNLEAHGFVSFGHLHSWGNNWLGETRSGSNEFWEAAANAIARPMDRLRIGAQLFVRDLGPYDNGTAQLDWAYADWRASDQVGIQIGRVKIPLGLFNESLDIDSARSSVFLPQSIYSYRNRDLYISTDGAKVYGVTGPFEYAVYGGAKRLANDAGFGTFLAQLIPGSTTERISVGWLGGGMVHWNTPLEGLGLRVSLIDAHDYEVENRLGKTTFSTHVDDYLKGIASAIYETDHLTYTAEYLRVRARGETTISPANRVQPLRDDLEGIALNATWHAHTWLDLFAGGEGSFAEPGNRTQASHSYTAVLAVDFLPLPNWSLKAEFRDVHGTRGAYGFENPAGIEKRWQVLALKSTVDF